MKLAILAGGFGSRLAEETDFKPKPMVEIGGMPILLHIMKYCSFYNFRDFLIALGYKGDVIKKYFLDLHLDLSNLTVNTYTGDVTLEDSDRPNWTVKLIETGLKTRSGGRLKRLKPYLSETFVLANGDGLFNIDLNKLIEFHRSHGRLATLTAVQYPSQFGHITSDGDRVISFIEKPEKLGNWINAAVYVLEPPVFDYIESDRIKWELDPLERLTEDGQLMVYKHYDFWQCMDTIHDKRMLEKFWNEGNTPWKNW